jgi:hypothetical protein
MLAGMGTEMKTDRELMQQVYQILLTHPNTAEALDKCETMLREALAKQPAQQEPNPVGILLAVEEAIGNGGCPWPIEQAFDEYETQRKAAHGIKEKNA